MRKLVLALVAVLSFNFTSCGAFNTDKQGVAETVEVNTVHSTQLRGVWLSYFEIAEMCKGKTEEVYTGNVEEVVKNTAEAGLNTIFYQVRCFGDALYNSSVFPTSKYIVQNEGDAIEYDPFRIFIDIAKKYSISVHAWVNPFRVSYSEDFTLLSENNPARIFSEEGNSENQLLVCEKGIYYNPASEESRTLIISGIRELFENYDIDGIQFDDYFYPEEKTLNDVGMHKKYVENGGALSLGEWRRENVNSFISSVYSLVKSYGETKVFGVSPSAKLSFNDSVYADVRLWCKESGYIDYIMPQIYYGFENSFMPFEDVACEWASLERCDEVSLYCGFAVYKCGEKDENAGEGVNEWKVNDNMISEQYRYISVNNLFSGFSLFSYSYCFGWNKNDICTAEMGYLTSML